MSSKRRNEPFLARCIPRRVYWGRCSRNAELDSAPPAQISRRDGQESHASLLLLHRKQRRASFPIVAGFDLERSKNPVKDSVNFTGSLRFTGVVRGARRFGNERFNKGLKPRSSGMFASMSLLRSFGIFRTFILQRCRAYGAPIVRLGFLSQRDSIHQPSPRVAESARLPLGKSPQIKSNPARVAASAFVSPRQAMQPLQG